MICITQPPHPCDIRRIRNSAPYLDRCHPAVQLHGSPLVSLASKLRILDLISHKPYLALPWLATASIFAAMVAGSPMYSLEITLKSLSKV